jgi:hypothetical protein
MKWSPFKDVEILFDDKEAALGAVCIDPRFGFYSATDLSGSQDRHFRTLEAAKKYVEAMACLKSQ